MYSCTCVVYAYLCVLVHMCKVREGMQVPCLISLLRQDFSLNLILRRQETSLNNPAIFDPHSAGFIGLLGYPQIVLGVLGIWTQVLILV